MSRETGVAALILLGSAVMLLASVGLVRMPDLYIRMQAATKASTLGLILLAVAAALHFGELTVTARAFLLVFFVLLTSPIGAHALGRAAYRAGVKPWTRAPDG